jgi:FkbM family methyltransferase
MSEFLFSQTPQPRSTCTWRLQCGDTTRSFTLFDTPIGQRICQRVLSGHSYPPLPIAGPIRTIVDIGANVGAAAVYFALHYRDARVLAFEPSPDSFELLRLNTADLGQVERFDFGLFDHDHETTLYTGCHDPVENSIGHGGEQTGHGVMIQLRRAYEVLSLAGVKQIDILKLDTEGCEVPILRSLTPMLPSVNVIYVEFHSERDRVEIDRLLGPTHSLFRGTVMRPFRGELVYVSRQCLPPSLDRVLGISI